MVNYNLQLETNRQSLAFNLGFTFLYAVIGLFVGQFVGLLLTLPFYGFDFNAAINSVTSFKDEQSRIPILLLQGGTALFTFVLAPLYFISRNTSNRLGQFFVVSGNWQKALILVFGITISFMFVNSIFIEWNKNIVFPESLKWFEEFAKDQELQMEKATIFMTTFPSLGVFLLAVLIIGVLPGVGEELLFRGLFQNIFAKSMNPHIAIWLTAILFSAFHLQFYGFVPRLLLGALFGYLYLWSGSLVYAMVGHFINNTFTLLMLYLYQIGVVEFDIQGTDSIPLQSVLIFLIIGVGLVYVFIKTTKTKGFLANE